MLLDGASFGAVWSGARSWCFRPAHERYGRLDALLLRERSPAPDGERGRTIRCRVLGAEGPGTPGVAPGWQVVTLEVELNVDWAPGAGG